MDQERLTTSHQRLLFVAPIEDNSVCGRAALASRQCAVAALASRQCHPLLCRPRPVSQYPCARRSVPTGGAAMYQPRFRLAWTVFLLACGPIFARGESRFTLSTMPRIDVHAHIGNNWAVMDEYMELRDAINKELNVE